MSKYDVTLAQGSYGPGATYLGTVSTTTIDQLDADLKKTLEQVRTKPVSALYFDDVEYKRHMDFWLPATQPKSYKHDQHGIHLVMQNGCRVTIQKEKITLGANADAATIRALVLHAKNNWNGSLSPVPPVSKHDPHQLLMIWANCEALGVKYEGPAPSKEMAEQIQPLIAHLRAQEAAAAAPQVGLAETQKEAPKAKKSKAGKKFDIKLAEQNARRKAVLNAGAKLF